MAQVVFYVRIQGVISDELQLLRLLTLFGSRIASAMRVQQSYLSRMDMSFMVLTDNWFATGGSTYVGNVTLWAHSA